MPNERKTEQLVRTLLKEKGYANNNLIIIEEQSSDNPKIDKLLKNASKGGSGKGYPEFIISFKNNPKDLILIECKATISKHESKDRKSYKEYAVDGVLLYASYLKDFFNVTAIAVSGQNEKEKKISSFLWLKKSYTFKKIEDNTILTPDEISTIVKKESKPISENELIKRAIEYNSFLNTYSIPEVERCTLISAILISLQDKPFLSSYQMYSNNQHLIENLINACKRVLKQNHLDDEKTAVIIDEYSKFKNNVSFTSQTFYNKKSKQDEVNKILRDFIILINENILPYIHNSQFDVLGKFYTQFIRYAGTDKKTGLVLTPSHITNFFCEIADLDIDDVVFDECCGTAGFLVSAMNYMLKKAGNNTQKKTQIKSSQLLGIEARSDMFSHACSNMMMRGDGKSHILYGDCFKEENINKIKEQKPTKAFLNPPYQDGNADEQLEFVENAINCLVKDGLCIAICQMSTTVSNKKEVLQVRERLLSKHTLEGVFTMPTELFHPVGVNTSILIFKAHNKHPKAKKSFFGYFKDDGFVKTKNQGRVDKNNKWNSIKRIWLNAYMNKENIPGLSVMQEVTKDDEWCAEAYMETDYSTFSKEHFITEIHRFSSFLFSVGSLEEATKKAYHTKKISLNDRGWKWFKLYPTLFKMYAGKYYPKESYTKGSTPLISSSENNNGVMSFTDIDPKYINCITIGKIGASSFYQPKGFVASPDVTVLEPIFKMNSYISLFITTLLNREKYKWSYGRQIRLNDSKKLKIKLPITKEGSPDWSFIEMFIKSLSYSKNLQF